MIVGVLVAILAVITLVVFFRWLSDRHYRLNSHWNKVTYLDYGDTAYLEPYKDGPPPNYAKIHKNDGSRYANKPFIIVWGYKKDSPRIQNPGW